jgi:hypothetical protein
MATPAVSIAKIKRRIKSKGCFGDTFWPCLSTLKQNPGMKPKSEILAAEEHN